MMRSLISAGVGLESQAGHQHALLRVMAVNCPTIITA